MSESRRMPRGLETSRQIVVAPVFLPELRKYDADGQLPWWSALGGLSPVYLAEMPNGSRAVSGGAGRFVMENLPPGSYQVRAVCGGFESPTLGVVVSEARQARVLLVLEPEGRSGRDLRRCDN